jgi:hypothetical protein
MLVLLVGGIYEVHIEMGSGGMMYIPSFIKTGLGIKKLLERNTHTDTQTQWWSHKPTFIFSKQGK